jgi:hypothetical protein
VGSPTFDTSRARFGDLIAGAAGVVLFISLFLNWYSVDVKSSVGGFSGGTFSQSVSGWKAMGFIDILLAACALIAIAVAVARMAGALPRTLPLTPGQILLGVGGLALLLTLIRIIFIPHGDVPDIPGVKIDFGREIGVFLAFLSAIAMTVGGWLTWSEEGRPAPGQAGRAGGPTPVGAGQPYGGGQPGGATAVQPAAAQPAATPPAGGQPAGGQATSVGSPAAGVGGAPGGGAGVPGGGGAAGAAAAGDPAPPAGGKADWYPDPRGEKRLRYYDGTSWTNHTAD